MSNTDFLGRAIEVVKKAIETDTAGEYEQAYKMYYQACEAPRLQHTLGIIVLTIYSGALHARLEM
jgi:hypothetical protein